MPDLDSMPEDPSVICITCGRRTGSPPRLNRLPDDRLCPSCRDRFLDHLPPLLPGERGAELRKTPDPGSERNAVEDEGDRSA
jgi:hypothetical protein